MAATENEKKPWMVQVGRGGGTAYTSQHANRAGAEQQARTLTAALGSGVSLWNWDGKRWVEERRAEDAS